VFARLPKLLIALALAGSIGLHWAFLQAVAWTGMIVSYSQAAPLSEAMQKTFDGRHPCKLCRQIAKEKQSEKKSEYKFEAAKLEFRYAPTTFIFHAPSSFCEHAFGNEAADRLADPPGTPPPRPLQS
jgi:hypothetical protein